MILLKLAAPTDIALIESIGKQSYRHHFSDAWSASGLEAYLDRHFSEPVLQAHFLLSSIRYYFPIVDDVVTGLVKIKLNSPLPVEPADKGLELEKIYLLKNFVGRGIGGAILSAMDDEARSRKAPFLWLDVLKSNAGARDLYTRHGFQTIGEIPFATDVRDIGMWIMRKDI